MTDVTVAEVPASRLAVASQWSLIWWAMVYDIENHDLRSGLWPVGQMVGLEVCLSYITCQSRTSYRP